MTKQISHRAATWALAFALGIPFATFAKEGNPPAKLKVDAAAINRDARTGNSYASVVKKVTPSVVNIYSTKTVKLPRYQQFFNDPLFEQFFGPQMRGGRGGNRHNLEQKSLGSGVIVTEDGYILTNNHVVDGADSDGVEVALGDGKQKFKAKVVGTDPQTDLAVLKIDAKGLEAITLADSDKLEVGDVVLAIGNPFNVGQTVTMGIVSALGRGGFGITDYEDFIQTDAAINPGNSGGALVDTQGRLIGINQSIVSGSGGNMGVGFAVPVNLAKSVLERLVDDGKVTRGFLGVMLQPLTPEFAKSLDLADSTGALVGDVSPNTPAEAAGIQPRDVIVAVDGKKASDSRHLRLMISQSAPGAKVVLSIIRDGKSKEITVKLGSLPGSKGEEASGSLGTDKNSEHDGLDGVTVDDISTEARRDNSIPASVKGVLVLKVDEESNAYEAGLRTGNVILEIDKTPVRTAEQAVKLCEEAKGERLLIRVWSNEGKQSGSRFLSVDNTKKK
ncbi:MAG: hypothetical protein RLY20_1681 [Verrucomicrobiota bacterium]|jgi:serine protease Do